MQAFKAPLNNLTWKPITTQTVSSGHQMRETKTVSTHQHTWKCCPSCRCTHTATREQPQKDCLERTGAQALRESCVIASKHNSITSNCIKPMHATENDSNTVERTPNAEDQDCIARTNKNEHVVHHVVVPTLQPENSHKNTVSNVQTNKPQGKPAW